MEDAVMRRFDLEVRDLEVRDVVLSPKASHSHRYWKGFLLKSDEEIMMKLSHNISSLAVVFSSEHGFLASLIALVGSVDMSWDDVHGYWTLMRQLLRCIYPIPSQDDLPLVLDCIVGISFNEDFYPYILSLVLYNTNVFNRDSVFATVSLLW